MKNNDGVNENRILHLEEISSENANESMLGRKGLSLFKLYSFDVPIPDFFVIPPDIFNQFIKRVLDQKGEELLKEKNPDPRDILNIFQKFDFDNDIKSEILKEYTKLSGFSDAWVSVRSSVCAPTYPNISFSGVFQTDLNVRGFNNVLKSVKNIFASMLTDSAVMYAVREGVELADISIAVVVQKMVHAEVSGTSFTLDPVTLDVDKMSIEAVFGLGDVIGSGEITPDTYQIIKKDLKIIEKHISPQDWMKIRALNGDKGGFEKINISSGWSHRQKLEDKYIAEVSKISLLIEDKVGQSVDVEWVLSGGRVYILQFKPAYSKESYLSHHIQYGGYSYVASTVGQVISELIGRKDTSKEMINNSMMEATKLVTKNANIANNQVSRSEDTDIKQEEVQSTVKAITSGIGVSFGTVKGVLKAVTSPLLDVKKEDILLIDEYNSNISSLIIKSGGVIAKNGGLTSELAILCREFGIPAVVGVTITDDLIGSGDIVEIDGNSGNIYLIDRKKQEQIEVARDIVSKQSENIVISTRASAKMEVKDQTPSIFTATKVFVTPDTDDFISGSDGVVYVDLDQVLIKYGKHPVDILNSGDYRKYAQEVITPVINIATQYSPKEVVLVIGKSTTSEFKKIAKDESSENDLVGNIKGASRYLANKKCLDVVIRLVKRIRNIHGLRNVSLAIYQPQGGNIMREIKKEVSARGLRRGSSFNIYGVVENPAEVIMSEDILDAEIDGLIVDTPILARHVFSLPMAAKDVVYDLSSNSIFKILDTVVQSTKSKSKRLIVFVEDDKDFVKYCVNKGVYGIVVPSKYLSSAKQLVLEQEAKIILSVT